MSDPFEYAPDEEPGDDDRALWADAAAEMDELDDWADIAVWRSSDG